MNKTFFYCCGPTTYNDLHIGNLKTMYYSRVIFNLFSIKNDAIFCMNYTDVDDKIIEKSLEYSSFFECSNKFLNICQNTIEKFNLKTSNNVFHEKITDYISDILEIIDKLIEKEMAYINEDGIYFNISNLCDEKALNKVNINQIPFYFRLTPNRKRKISAMSDFVLWKFSSKEPYWNTKWGKGRPGWHIECSAVCKYFIEKFNIKRYIILGGIDICFPHHENQATILDIFLSILEKEVYMEKAIHINSLFIDKKKMSKQLNNMIYLKDINPYYFDALKLFFLSNSINSRTEFSHSILESNEKKLRSLGKKFKNKNELKEFTKETIHRILQTSVNEKSFYNIPKFFSEIFKMEDDSLDRETLYSFLRKNFLFELK